MNIRLAKPEEAPRVAQIHYNEINQGFLRQIGLKFLSLLYLAMIKSSSAFVVVAEENNKIYGFIGGCTNVSSFYKEFLRNYFWRIFLILFTKIFSFNVLGKIVEDMLYPTRKEERILPQAELLVIAVKKESQGRGLAVLMFDLFLAEMRKKQIRNFKVIVGEQLKPAVKFYEKVGFKLHSNIIVHQGESSRVYVYTL